MVLALVPPGSRHHLAWDQLPDPLSGCLVTWIREEYAYWFKIETILSSIVIVKSDNIYYTTPPAVYTNEKDR